MKKRNLLFVLLSLIMLTACQSKKSYHKKVNEVYIKALLVASLSESEASTVAKIWSDAIFDKKDEDGSYCYDFNDALSRHADKVHNLRKALRTQTDSLAIYAADLKDYPKDCESEYNDLIDIISSVTSLTRMATDPSGSLSSYRDSYREVDDDVARKFDSFKIKHADVLKDASDDK